MLRELLFEAMLKRKRQAILERLEAVRLCEAEPEGPPLPAMPTSHCAGSQGKIEAMRQRVERGEAVFHPDDSKQKVEQRFRSCPNASQNLGVAKTGRLAV